MKLIFWYSAATTIETPDLRILTDPWFGLGNNWDGSWCAYPPLLSASGLMRDIGPVDYIYISHVHDDHYCPEFLAAYLDIHPQTHLLVPNSVPLLRRLKQDLPQIRGKVIEWPETVTVGATQFSVVISAPTGVRYPIDSALVVRWGSEAVINLNDCPWDMAQLSCISSMVEGAATKL